MNVLKILAVAVVCLLLPGCAANSLRVVQSSPRTVTLEYNSVLTGIGEVSERAEQEASKYGKHAVVRDVIDKRRKTKWGAINTIVFDVVN